MLARPLIICGLTRRMLTVVEDAQYLTFVLDGEVFALEIERVREVLEVTEITRVPRAPSFVRGVTNLRGSVVPVVDLREKFGLGTTPTTVDTCIVIAEVTIDEERTVIGALADSVQEVVELAKEQIAPPPRMGTRLRTKFIAGMGRRDDTLVMVLNIDEVFSSEELAVVEATAGAHDADPVRQEPERADAGC